MAEDKLHSTEEMNPAVTDVRHVGPTAKLLKTNLSLHPTHLQGDSNKENWPPVPHKQQTIYIAKINEIIDKCVAPTNAPIHIPPQRIIEEPANELKSRRKRMGI